MAYTYRGHGFDWSAARVEVLKALWKDGKSAGQIAEHFANRVSRNAVIGKLHRLGLTNDDRSKVGRTRKPYLSKRRADLAAQSKSQRHGGPTRSRTEQAVALATRGGKSHDEIAAELGIAPSTVKWGVSMAKHGDIHYEQTDIAKVANVLDLEAHHCRFPITIEGVHGFCGDTKVSGLPYCEAHAKRCYRGTVSSPNEFRLADFKARPKVPA